MFDQEQIARWVIGVAEEPEDLKGTQFLEATRRAWPRNLALARREMANQRFYAGDASSLAMEIWEVVLRSVWKTFREGQNNKIHIRNLNSYLVGAFHHRLNRHLERTRHRNAVIEFVPPEKLNMLQIASRDSAAQIYQHIQLKQVYAAMEYDIRRAIIARNNGFSWAEIASTLGAEKQNLIMRVQYAIRKVRDKFGVTPHLKMKRNL